MKTSFRAGNLRVGKIVIVDDCSISIYILLSGWLNFKLFPQIYSWLLLTFEEFWRGSSWWKFVLQPRMGYVKRSADLFGEFSTRTDGWAIWLWNVIVFRWIWHSYRMSQVACPLHDSRWFWQGSAKRLQASQSSSGPFWPGCLPL